MIVDDSVFFREFMSRALSKNPSIEVVGMASSAMEAMEKIDELKPEVICLDMEMPKMRGTDFLIAVKPKYPGLRVVVISSNPNNAFDAMRAGAVDFVPKPGNQVGMDNNAFIQEAVHKIKIAAYAAVSRLASSAAPPPASPAVAALKGLPVLPNTSMPSALKVRNTRSVIAIGASTGGTEAILSVIKDFPTNTPGIVIVQHMPPVFTRLYAERLDKTCKMSVKEAQHGDRVEPGRVLIAAGDKHMRLRNDGAGYSVACETGEKVSGHMPSVDVLFESVAKCAGSNAIGVILTGMGADGAKMLLQMRKEGSYTIGQDQDSCVVYGMPMVAYNIGGVADQMPLSKIPAAIVRKLSM